MSDFSVRSESVDVEQIMRQIRARIREKRGVDYTEEEIRELANVKLEKFIDPKGVRSDLLQQYRQAREAALPPNYKFEDTTLFETHRGALAFIRRLLNPILKLFFNPAPLIEALHIQSRLNDARAAMEPLQYELMHNLVIELTRTTIEVKNLKMRLESISSRLDFDERRARALEGVVQYRPGAVPPLQPPTGQEPRRDQGRRDQGRRDQGRFDQGQGQRDRGPRDAGQQPPRDAGQQPPRDAGQQPPRDAGQQPPREVVQQAPREGQEANALDNDGNERRARRRRRRGRRRGPGDDRGARTEAGGATPEGRNARSEAGGAPGEGEVSPEDRGSSFEEREPGTEERSSWSEDRTPVAADRAPAPVEPRQPDLEPRTSTRDSGGAAPETPAPRSDSSSE